MGKVAERYIAIAKDAAQQSKCMRRRFGCVIVVTYKTHAYRKVMTYNRTPYDLPCTNCMRSSAQPGTNYDTCLATHAEEAAVQVVLTKYKAAAQVKLYVYGEDVATGREVVAVEPCADCAVALRKLGDRYTVIGHNEYGEVVEWDKHSLYKEIRYVERA